MLTQLLNFYINMPVKELLDNFNIRSGLSEYKNFPKFCELREITKDIVKTFKTRSHILLAELEE